MFDPSRSRCVSLVARIQRIFQQITLKRFARWQDNDLHWKKNSIDSRKRRRSCLIATASHRNFSIDRTHRNIIVRSIFSTTESHGRWAYGRKKNNLSLRADPRGVSCSFVHRPVSPFIYNAVLARVETSWPTRDFCSRHRPSSFTGRSSLRWTTQANLYVRTSDVARLTSMYLSKRRVVAWNSEENRYITQPDRSYPSLQV